MGAIKVELLGHTGALEATQDEEGLKITLPADRPGNYDYTFKITGFNLHALAAAPAATGATAPASAAPAPVATSAAMATTPAAQP